MADWFLHLHPAIQALVRVVLFVIPVLLLVPGSIWFERRLLGWFQDRVGPNRAGTITWSRKSGLVPGFLKGKKTHLFGLLQPILDGVKLFFKEDITPGNIDRLIYFVAPAVALFPAFALGGTIPWGPFRSLTPIADVNIGVLYILAVSSLGVYGIVLSGYASNNKYSLLGGLRSSAQLISYELGMSMSLACIVMATGSLKPTDMVAAQEQALWGVVGPLANWNIFTPYGFVGFVVFFICMIAETNRAPFDLPEAENELVAGYHTEYSSMKFAVFFMGEYAAMFVYGGILSTVFLGGYHMLPVRWDYLKEALPGVHYLWERFEGLDYWFSPIWFIGKCALVIAMYIWLRATLPRLRYDQLMSLGWKSLLPLATANLIVVALWIVATRVYGPYGGWAAAALAVGILVLIYRAVHGATRATNALGHREVSIESGEPAPRTVELVDPVVTV
jgi:NADH-quinone oxidoreductase subunit H